MLKNLVKGVYAKPVVDICFAFRGRVVSFLGLAPCGISPISYFPQESTHMSTTKMITSCIYH